MTTTNPDNNYINVDHSTTAIQDHFLMTNKGIIIAFFLSVFFGAFDFAISFWLQLPTYAYYVMMLPMIPIIITLALWPYGVNVRVDKLNQTIRFRTKCIVYGAMNCKDKNYRLDDVSEFTIGKVSLFGTRYYTIYLNYKSGLPQEPIITGLDNSCRFDFAPELDNIPVMLNNWIKM